MQIIQYFAELLYTTYYSHSVILIYTKNYEKISHVIEITIK